MARVRSPNFPVISLPGAIERVEEIYDKEQTVPADRETLAMHLGYSGMNGASMKVLSALAKYGLLEDSGDKQFAVSKLAMAIMHPESEAERIDALKEAARGPVLFNKLNEQFDGQRPSETNLRSWLLRNGFGKSAVDSVIKAYSETMDLVGSNKSSYSAPASTPTSSAVKRSIMQSTPAYTGGGPSMSLDGNADPFSVELLKGRVRVVGDLSNREDAMTLMEFLKSAMAFLPSSPDSKVAENDENPD